MLFSARLAIATTLIIGAAACSGTEAGRIDSGVPSDGDGGVSDGGRREDGGGTTQTDGGAQPSETCSNAPIAAATNGTCNVTAGDKNLLIRGDLVGPNGIIKNGHLLIDQNGVITCAACDCTATAGFETATKIECAEGLISPGLVNAHDHITFNEGGPVPHTEVYEHRHDWRTGRNGSEEIPSPQNKGGVLGVRWSEIRNLIAGTTSVNGSGSAPGLVRNLDRTDGLEGLPQPAVRYSTFPLGDSRGTTKNSGCDYGTDGDSLTDNAIAQADAYTPHVAEGIDLAARNEMLCLDGAQMGGNDVIAGKTAIIHGVGLNAADYGALASEGASLIWSPRSNVDLYGNTAMVTTAARVGVRIGLGTDWTASGSMNMLRELRCASDLNKNYYGSYFTDRQLVDMATINSAAALWSDDHLGALKAGLRADVAIFDQNDHQGYKAILEGNVDGVVLVLRSGVALYGDKDVISALDDDRCEALDVCGRAKSICVERDTGTTLAEIRAAIRTDNYPLFFCGTPDNEPSCLPHRPSEYTGMSRADDKDGDGVADAMDLCPDTFDPPRPLDGDTQADTDQDGAGDACDPCPLAANTESCAAPRSDDRDGDGVKDSEDNCAGAPNPGQEDQDRDMTGDSCDACPTVANTGGAPCPVNVYDVKQGRADGTISISDVIVTAIAPAGYFVQIPVANRDATLGENYSGLYVFAGRTAAKPALGDRIDLVGTVTEYFGQIQLTTATHTVRSSGAELPAPIVVEPAVIATGGDRAAALEGVLVEVRDVAVTDVAPAAGAADMAPTNEFVVDGALRVNDFMYLADPFPAANEQIGFVRGVLRFANENSKIEPRNADDLGVAAQLRGIEPGVRFVRANTSTTVHEVTLTRSTASAVTVSIRSSDASVTVPATVTIPAGSRSVPLPITTRAATTSSVTITAEAGGITKTATVRTYDDATPRRLSQLTVSAPIASTNMMFSGTVTVDVPAGQSGVTVEVTVEPANLATVAGPVVIPRDRTSATFSISTSAETGSGTLVARSGGVTLRTPFQVSTSRTRAVGQAGDLIITEILWNPTGSNDEKMREWFELYNPTADRLNLDGLVVSDRANRSFTIRGADHVVAPGAYIVLAYDADPTVNGGMSGDVVAYGSADLVLSNSGGAVTIAIGGTTIDQVVWATGWPGANGVAMCLKAPYAPDNAVQGAWGAAASSYGPNGDKGSPGIQNDATNCP